MTFRVSNVNLNTAGTIQVFNNTTSNNIVLRVDTGQHTINSTSIVANVTVANSSGVFKSGSPVGVTPYNVGDVTILNSASPQPANTLICNTAYAKASYPTLSALAVKPYLDNITITDRGNPQTLEQSSIYIAFGNNIFVAGSTTSFFYRSTNGTTWTEQSVAGTQFITDIAYGNGVFVLTGSFDTGGGLYEFRRTTNGITWNNVTAPSNFMPQTIDYGNGFFVTTGTHAVSSNSMIYRSTDGTTWTGPTYNAAVGPKSVIYGNGVFLAISNTTSVYRSTDNGGTFTSSTITGSVAGNFITNQTKLAYGNGLFVSTINTNSGNEDREHQYITSTDGLTWSVVPLSSTRRTATKSYSPNYAPFGNRDLVYVNNLFVSSVEYGYEISQNGSNWVFIPGTYKQAGKAAYGNGIYVFPTFGPSGAYSGFTTSPLATYDTSTHFKIQAPTNILANQVAYVRYQ